MPLWGPYGFLLPRPETLWAQRVLLDLSALRETEAIGDTYLRRAWLTITLIAVADDPLLVDDGDRRSAIRLLVLRAGLVAESEDGVQSYELDDVFGDASGSDRRTAVAPAPDDEGILHLIPGFSIAGARWEFHLTDKDSNRPAPHGHDVADHSTVLDPYTGDVLDKNSKLLRGAKPKELKKLWDDPTFRRFADRARVTMQQQQPWRTDALPPLPDGK